MERKLCPLPRGGRCNACRRWPTEADGTVPSAPAHAASSRGSTGARERRPFIGAGTPRWRLESRPPQSGRTQRIRARSRRGRSLGTHADSTAERPRPSWSLQATTPTGAGRRGRDTTKRDRGWLPGTFVYVVMFSPLARPRIAEFRVSVEIQRKPHPLCSRSHSGSTTLRPSGSGGGRSIH